MALFCTICESAAGDQVELVSNGTFESGTSYWNVVRLGACDSAWIGSGPCVYSGSYRAVLGDFSGCYASPGSIHQQVSIPTNAGTITLRYYVNITSDEGTTTAYDKLDAAFRTFPGDSLITTADSRSNKNKGGAWGSCPSYTERVVDVSSELAPYRGQTVTLQFYVITDDSDYPTLFRVDNVSLIAALQQQTGSLQVTLSPSSAVSAGAQWNVDGGAWKNSGATVSGLSAGSHAVSFKSVTGWSKPGDKNVAVYANQTTYESGEYSQQSGSLQVTLSPQGAIDAGAQWNVDGGAWKNSGATVSGLSAGSHTVSFKSVTGWTKPGDRNVTVYANQTTYESGEYSQESGSLQVTLSPQDAMNSGAQWNVDGGAWKNGGATVSGLSAGSHTVSFKSVTGWTKPGDKNVTVYANQTTYESGEYSQESGSLQVTLSPQDAMNSGAQWNVDGGAWKNSGTTVSGLSVGQHMVSFKAVSGWSKPGDQTVNVYANQTATTSGAYSQQPLFGSLQVTISPPEAVNAGGRWRRTDTSTWRSSGSTETDIPLGSYTVEFKDISGWTRPSDQFVTIDANQTAPVSGTYSQQNTTAPLITSIVPDPVPGSDSPQWITINGSGFQDGLKVFVAWTGGSKTLADSQVSFLSSSQLRIYITTLNLSGGWTVEVINVDGTRSGLKAFRVEAIVAGCDNNVNPEGPPGTQWLCSPFYASRNGTPITAIVIHTTNIEFVTSVTDQQRYDAAVSWFRDGPGVSAHYVIGPDGHITQMVRLSDSAQHAYYYNPRSIGIEVAGAAEDATTWTPAKLDALATLVAWLVQRYPGIPVEHPAGDATSADACRYDKAGIVGHYQIQTKGCFPATVDGNRYLDKPDPGAYFHWDSCISGVRARLNPADAHAPTASTVPDEVSDLGSGEQESGNDTGQGTTAPAAPLCGAGLGAPILMLGLVGLRAMQARRRNWSRE